MVENYYELEEPELLTLEDEDGTETVFEQLAVMDVDDKTYVALTPHFDNPEDALGGDAELVVLVSEEDGDEEYLASIEDDDEYERIGQLFLERLGSYYDEEGEEDEEE